MVHEFFARFPALRRAREWVRTAEQRQAWGKRCAAKRAENRRAFLGSPEVRKQRFDMLEFFAELDRSLEVRNRKLERESFNASSGTQ
jgi:hypothetical protein